MRIIVLLLLLGGSSVPSYARSELIVLASPALDDDYYRDVEDSIFDFHLHFARQVAGRDRLVVLTDESRAADYIQALGEARVMIMPMLDIWMRDFTLANPVSPIMFRYTAVAQDDQSASDEVQDVFYAFARQAGLVFEQSDWFNDGGNFVDDGHGNVVISTKFLKDNGLTETDARKRLTRHPSIHHVAFIEADEQGGLEHADGVVSFIDKNTLVVNSYPEDPDYAAQLKADLERGLPGVRTFELPTPYDGSRVYDERFGSACGLYTNALVTPERIYLPQFGVPEDKAVLNMLRALTSKEIVPVNSHQVCFMGGGVRCMSWQLRGANAEKMLDFVSTQTER